MADLVALLHAIFSVFAVGGPILLTAGLLGDWHWVRRRAFRWSLALAVSFVAGRAALGIPCPLSSLESRLRDASAEELPTWVTATHVMAFRGTEDKVFAESSTVWALFTFTLLGATTLLERKARRSPN